MNPLLITSYTGPDLDGFASAFAYAEFLNDQGKNASFGFAEPPHKEAQFLLDKYNIPFQFANIDPTNFGEIILVDASDVIGIDPRIKIENVTEIIDHRKVNDANVFKNAKIQIEFVGSVATLIAEKFINSKLPITKNSALLLYGAIISNTLNFQAHVTTDRDKNAAQWLAEQFSPEPNFVHEMFADKSDINPENLKASIEEDFAHFDLGKKIGVGQLEVINAEAIVKNLSVAIINELDKIKADQGLDMIFMSVIDLEKNRNFFIAKDREAQELLQNTLNVNFENNIAVRDGLIMRKEIIPLIKQTLS